MKSADLAVHAFPPVEDLIPHKRSMVLLDRLCFADATRAVTSVELREGSKFVRGGFVRGLVIVEYMAQTIACHVGMLARCRDAPIEIGFLVGVRDLRIDIERLLIGDLLTIEVNHVFGDERVGSYQSIARRGSEDIAKATLTVYRAKSLEELP